MEHTRSGTLKEWNTQEVENTRSATRRVRVCFKLIANCGYGELALYDDDGLNFSVLKKPS